MPQVDWNLIVETIRAEKCVILLGPDFAVTQDGKHLMEALLERLDLKQDDQLKFVEPDDLFQFKDPILRTRTYFKLKGLYRELESEIDKEPFQHLAQIGVHLIFTLSPNLYLRNIFEEMNIPHRFEYYNKTVNPPDIVTPKADSPLIFNLFGSTDEEQSLILTHNDLYDFLFAILGDHHLPDELKNTLHSAANFIFLGFSFDKWYMQLLLRLLNLHDERYNFDRYAASKKMNKDIQVFYSEQFRINFVESDAKTFVKTLFEECEKAGLTRDPDAKDRSISERISSFLENDKIAEAISALMEFFELKGEEELVEEVQLLSSRFKRLQRKIQQDVIDNREAEIDTNKIQVALLDVTKEVKRLESA